MSTQDKTPNTSTDLDFESVSAFHDGELNDTQLAERLQEDPEAQSFVDAYSRIDEAILKSLACPADQEQAIIAGSVRRAKEAGRPSVLQFSLQIVAGIAAAAIIVFAWRATRPAAPATTVATAPTTAETPAEVAVAPPTRPSVSPAEKFSGNATIRLQDIQLVSAGAEAKRPVIAERPSTAPVSTEIGSSVRHVWLVKDATKPLKALRPLLAGQESTIDYWIKENRDSYRLQLNLNDRDLQGLVNQLDGLGFALLSPEAPQPGLFREGSFTEKPVVYEVHFVEE